MRARILLPSAILTLGMIVLLLDAPVATSQGFGKKGKSSKYDPQLYFDKLAQGNSVISISNLRDPDRRDELNVFAKKVGITGDQISRDQFLKFFEMRDEIRAGLSFDKLSQGKGVITIASQRDPDRRDELMAFAKRVGITGDQLTREQYLKFLEMRDEIRAGLSFDRLTQGKGFFLISEVRDRGRKEELTLFAKKVGISDDRVSREQYQKFLEMRDQLRDELRGSAPANPNAGNERNERLFKGYDRNGDGFLNSEEIQATTYFKSEWEKWDANKDSRISLDEWLAYSAARDQRMGMGKSNASQVKPGTEIVTIDDASRTVTWRAGKLPDGLPDWFREFDLNKDAQVAMYEWRQKSTEPLSKFLAMDANDDGLLTPDEVLRFQRNSPPPASDKKSLAASEQINKSKK